MIQKFLNKLHSEVYLLTNRLLIKTNTYTKLEKKKKNLYMTISSALNVRNGWECSGDKLWVMNLW